MPLLWWNTQKNCTEPDCGNATGMSFCWPGSSVTLMFWSLIEKL